MEAEHPLHKRDKAFTVPLLRPAKIASFGSRFANSSNVSSIYRFERENEAPAELGVRSAGASFSRQKLLCRSPYCRSLA